MAGYYAPVQQHEFEFYENTQIAPFNTHNATEYQDYSSQIKRLAGYDRDSLATGVDLKLNLGDDLALNGNGDLELETGSALVQNALARRLATPPGGYQRYIYIGDELISLDEDYGNPLYYMLSQIDPEKDSYTITQTLKKAAEPEVRVSDVSVRRFIIHPKTNRYILELHYRIKSNQELYALELEMDRSN